MPRGFCPDAVDCRNARMWEMSARSSHCDRLSKHFRRELVMICGTRKDSIWRQLRRSRLAFSALLLAATSTVEADNISTQALSEFASQELAETLNATGPLVFRVQGDVLFVGNFIEPQLSQFGVATNGELSFNRTTDLSTLGADVSSSRQLALNASGTVLYSAGEHSIAVLSYDSNSAQLSLVTEITVEPQLTITSLALSPDDRDLYVVSNNFSFDTTTGASTLTHYRVDPETGMPTLLATRTEPQSDAPLNRITLARSSDLVFLGRRTSLEVHTRNTDSGVLALLTNNLDAAGGTVTDDGEWLFNVQPTMLRVYRVEAATGVVTLTQEFRSAKPPLLQRNLSAARAVALSSAEDRLFVTGYQQVGIIAGGIRAISSSDVFVRDAVSGELRRDGGAVSVGSSIVRHPDNDWFYTYIPSTTSFASLLPPRPVITQQALLPPLQETKIIAAVLPGSRSEGNRNQSVTAFATVLNTGETEATGCRAGVLRETLGGLNFSTFEVDAISNNITGGLNAAFSVPPGGATNLVLEFSTALDDQEFTATPELLDMRFFCNNSQITDRVTGVTTFAFASDPLGLPDLLTASASPDNPGIVSLPDPAGSSFFTVATLNLGTSAVVTASAALELANSVVGAEPLDNLPSVSLSICETDSQTSQCKAPFADQVERTIGEDEIVTYTVVVQGQGSEIPFLPETNRAFILFKDVDGNLRGSSSVAIETR